MRVATIERTLVDILAEPDYGGSWDEIYQSLTRADSIDVAMVAVYCQMRDGGAVMRAKVGFFLDQRRELWEIEASDLDQFRPQGPRATMFAFDTYPRKRTHYVEDWNLVVPVEVIERQWELVF